MPSNSIFRILTGLFIAGLPIWTMNAFYTQHNPLLKISRLLPYLFAPLVLLQAYSIGIRITKTESLPCGMSVSVSYTHLYSAFSEPCGSWNIAVGSIAKEQTVKKRQQIHSCKKSPGVFHRKQMEDKAGEINRADIIAESQHQFGFPSGKLSSLVAFRRHTGTHGKTAQETDNQYVNAGIG